MTDLFNLRRDFTLKTLNEEDVHPNPVSQFEIWFDEALKSESIEPNAMSLSTATRDGRPSSRIVLLKQIRQDGFVFFTNYESRKGIQLDENPYCALNFVWHELERQIRIEGVVSKLSSVESDAYFELRPEKSKFGAWASPQSRIIERREFLESLLVDVERKFGVEKVTRPDNWGGYLVEPFLIEFWQGRANRLHDRMQYRLDNGNWIIERLAP